MKKLIAIDGNSLMHRAYYALPNMTTAAGVPTGALHGFLSMLLKLVAMEPDYLVVAFDMHGPTFRHESYDAYKAGRKETPEDLKTQFPMLKELLTAMGVAICECPRYEADDILGTFSRMCDAAGMDSLLVTGDRDALQLIDGNTHVLMTKKGITDTIEYDAAALMEAYGLSPDRMRDLKGLMGDASDHIPGIPGVGEKTALKLLETYETLENVLAHGNEIKGKLGEKVVANADSARMSYRLGTICTSAPITLTIEECRLYPEKMQNARSRLTELELRAIVSRLPEGRENVAAVGVPSQMQVIPIQTEAELREAIEKGKDASGIAMDVSDTISFAFDGDALYRMEQGEDLFSQGLAPSIIWNALAPFLADPKRKLLVFDAKRLMHLADRYHISVACSIFDAMIADYLLNAIRPASSLSVLLEQQLHTETTGVSQLFTVEAPMMRALEEAGMLSLYTDMELPLMRILYDMESRGFLVDEGILKQLQGTFGRRVGELEHAIYESTGEKFNILSPKQLGEVLFTKLGLPTKKKTKSGYSTDADTLESLRDLHPAVALILEYRFLTKLKSTFVDGLLTARDPADGRVRTRFNQCITATGRISSTEPNLQNIPVRTELGREIRKAFVASPGNVLVGADYSQIELRLLAHISGDPGMIDAFVTGADIHRRTASEVFGVAFADVTPEMRSAAKAVNFGIVYGISDFGLARNLGIPVKEAAHYIDTYFARYPGVKAYLDRSVQEAKDKGYAETLFHRRRAMPELLSSNYNTRSFGERVAMNMPIQGTAADIIKLAMVHAVQALRDSDLQAKMLLQVHDELIFDTPPEEVEQVKTLVRTSMEQVARYSVPLEADVKTGSSWFETK